MARSSGKRGLNTYNTTASDPLLGLTALVSPYPLLTAKQIVKDYAVNTLSDIADGRLWHPDPAGTVYSPAGTRVKSRLRDAGKAYRRFRAQTKAIRVFSHYNPAETAIVCARRKIRREVFHALIKKRRGSGGGKPRRTFRSTIKC